MPAVQVPVNVLHWLLAVLPIIVLLVFLVPLKWRTPEAGPMAMFTAAIVALVAFCTPWNTLAVASAKGVWDAIFILYVIWPALLLYHVTKQAGAYDALRQGISRFSRNELFIILALSWVFASFLQGIAGFGAPVAVVVPLLIAMGVKPVYSVAMGVVAHAWARFFGTLGVGWLATLQVANLADAARAAFESALLILIPTYLGGLFVVWLYGKWPAIRHAWPLVLILGTILGVGQLLAALISPELSTFLAGAVAPIALYPLSRWPRFGEPVRDVPERPAMVETRRDIGREVAPVMGLPMSFLPYIVLTAVTLSVLLIRSLNGVLRQVRIGLPFPAVATGFGVQNAAVARYAPITVCTHPGMMLLVTAIVIGALGAFMTSSSTASNVLFGSVQSSVAHLHGLSAETVIAAQASGSAYGNAIAPANVVLGTSIGGIKGQEGSVLRQTLPWTILVAVLTGLGTIALVLIR